MAPSNSSPQQWLDYPMGPAHRHLLGIDEDSYTGESAPPPSQARVDEFEAYISAVFKENFPLALSEILDLLEESVAMGLPKAAIHLAKLHEHLGINKNFTCQLQLGSAAMMLTDLDQALEYLHRAHNLCPEEPSPILNLVLIYDYNHEFAKSQQWAEAGLVLLPNDRRLWECLGRALLNKPLPGVENSSYAKKLALSLDSYTGLSLAAELASEGDALLKAEYLGEHYARGGREGDFLVEYTATLGLNGQYKKLAQVVWEAENMTGSEEAGSIPWQVYLHACQASASLNDNEQVTYWSNKTLSCPDVPPEVIQELKPMKPQSEKNPTHVPQ